MNKQQNETLKLIQNEEKAGNIVFQTFDGAMSCSIADIIIQPAEGILYDLNRDKLTTITLADTTIDMGMRWINDYAVAVVIEALKAEIDRLNELLSNEVEQGR